MNLRTTPLRRGLLVAAASLALAATAAGCDSLSAPSGQMTPATTGSIQAIGLYPGYDGVFCTDSSTWTYSAVTLDGTDGQLGPVVHTKPGTQTLPTNGQCQSSDLATSLKLGTWRVTWSAGASCVIDIHRMKWVKLQTNGNCTTG